MRNHTTVGPGSCEPYRMTFPSSADVLGPFLLLGLLLRLGGGRKLQHRCVLTFLKMGQKNCWPSGISRTS